tara:strand:+ start:310 stop:579 length:270 start_codon:yes stop_codon:yes gene_type:complete
MQNKFKNINLILDKIEIINDEKFSSDKFNNLNYSLETELNSIKSVIDEKIIDTQNEKLIVIDLISKIERLEAKILPKAELINSFSKSTI